MTRPGCECQGNRTPGCTVNLTTAMFEGSSRLITDVGSPTGFSRTCTATLSVKALRPVSGSARIGTVWYELVGLVRGATAWCLEAAVGGSEQAAAAAPVSTMASSAVRMSGRPGRCVRRDMMPPELVRDMEGPSGWVVSGRSGRVLPGKRNNWTLIGSLLRG